MVYRKRDMDSLVYTLYDFLPWTKHPKGKYYYTIPAVAEDLSARHLIPDVHSKSYGLFLLLSNAIQTDKAIFANLVTNIVLRGLEKPKNRGQITQDQVLKVVEQCERIGIRIKTLKSDKIIEQIPQNQDENEYFIKWLHDMDKMESIRRGREFEQFLNELFDFFRLSPNPAFRLKNEEIDGSFVLGHTPYLLEAKWHTKKLGSKSSKSSILSL
ncbi:hypothetical protein [Limimonas halophila]|uniref:hypothetical protein n=1 Tax=Limimonas halophila TaxID=1082479 RepID=UPI0015A33B49|nr:hypothetical protein [Limimonas halophila]